MMGLCALFLTLLGLTAATLPAPAATEKVIYTFQGRRDGGQPWGTLALDEKTGILYGTTESGGNDLCQNSFQFGCGTVFSLTPSPGSWTETVLYRFQGGSDGAHPRSPLVARPDGFFYGTTSTGGDPTQSGVGTAFRIQRGTWKEQVLFRFSSYSGGWYPQGSVAFDDAGNLYGLTLNAGTGTGVAFELLPNPSGSWTEQVLSSSVGVPLGGIVIDPAGNLLGTDSSGGVYSSGSVFELSPGNPQWQLATLYSFRVACGMTCGGAQPGSLAIRRSGDLLGFTGDGGIPACNGFGCGTVYEMVDSGGVWREQTIYEFQNLADGWGPGWGAPVFDRYGNIYGTTQGGGRYGFGTVFELSRVNGAWHKTTLYDFPGGAGGGQPLGSGLVIDDRGNLFGETYFGGVTGTRTCKRQGCGVVFEVMP